MSDEEVPFAVVSDRRDGRLSSGTPSA